MRFTDRTLLRFLDAAELGALLPPRTGRALLDAAYDFDDLAVGDVSGVSARLVALAPALAPELPVTVTARPLGGGQEWQVTGSWQSAAAPTVHAVLDVTVAAATRGVRTDVTAVEVEPLTGLRAQIEAAVDLDAAVDAIAAHVTDAPRDAVAQVLRRRGLTTLDAVRDAFGPARQASRLVLTLVSDATGADVERPYRLTVLAHAVEDLGTGLLDAVATLAAARLGLDAVADPPARPPGVTVREGRPGLVIFPAAALDDADLPVVAGEQPAGDAARRASRLSELTSRLRSSGIVPVAI
ncbi:hypothetical protein [Protofrankia sp. BMG5.30]|nr:hypothetical protein [Protofrankia sp. BMG5.30]ONH34489.1 hypothetical protein BL254_15665 [Protofrankia sp. BMG5.30]